MQQDAGLRLKCLGGRLACGLWPISLVYRATEWSCYGAACATSSCLPGGAKRSPGEAATSADGSRIAPRPVVLKNNINRAGNRIPRHRQYIGLPIQLYSITTQVRATQPNVSLSLASLTVTKPHKHWTFL